MLDTVLSKMRMETIYISNLLINVIKENDLQLIDNMVQKSKIIFKRIIIKKK